MICYLKGKIIQAKDSHIIIDVHDVGYQLLVSNVERFKVGENTIIYSYNVIREDEQYLVGFKTQEEKDVFLSLIKVKGLGPKTVVNAMRDAAPSEIIAAISSNNVAFLKKLPGVGNKAAAQIILDLKGELTGTKGNPKQYDEVFEALKELGFKGTTIDRVLATINEQNATVEDILKIALTKLRK